MAERCVAKSGYVTLNSPALQRAMLVIENLETNVRGTKRAVKDPALHIFAGKRSSDED
jgi:hypothetical protein